MIRQATEADWPLIEQWRDDHYAAMAFRMERLRPITGQCGFADAVWIVLEREGVVVAATAFRDDGMVRYGKAMYAARGHVMDGMKLAKWLERMCDDQGMELRASTDPENIGYIELLVKRGFEICSVELVRRARHGPR